MKPVKLKLAGLQSFREVQEIDFACLCEAGLFGIFGPTGSGKSTILDAITLALYGHIDRAARGTQGIINYAEDKLLVEFSFELANPGGRRSYRVERVYRRSGENTVEAAASRLIEITPAGEVPLAEKSRVTQKVEEILGLDRLEFTRAVVLPQGKFADFLKLEPARRRSMLQNLFGLHDYGDKLMLNVKERSNDAANRLARAKGEQDGIGDASDRALEQSSGRLAEARQKTECSAAARLSVEAQVKKLEQVRVWQDELSRVEQALTDLKQQKSEISRFEELLESAARAEIIKPSLLEKDEAEEKHKQAQGSRRDAGERLKLAQEKTSSARQSLEQVTKRSAEENPVFFANRERYERAAKLEDEVAAIKAEGSKLALALSVQEKEKQDTSSMLELLQQQKLNLEHSLNTCKRKLSAIQVTPEKRRLVNDSIIALQHYQETLAEKAAVEAGLREKSGELAKLRQIEAEATIKYRNAEKKLSQNKAQLIESGENCPDDPASLQSERLELERIRAQVQDIIRINNDYVEFSEKAAGFPDQIAGLEESCRRATENKEEAFKLLETARLQTKDLEAKLELLKIKHQASLLARSLREDEACPVCGSRRHPAPAPPAGEEDVKIAEGELRAARGLEEKTRDSLEEARREEERLAGDLKRLKAEYSQIINEQEKKKESLTQARRVLPGSWAEMDVAKLPPELLLTEEKLLFRQYSYDTWRQVQEKLSRAQQQAQEEYDRGLKIRNDAAGALKLVEGAHNEAVKRVEEALAKEWRHQSELADVRKDLPVVQIEHEHRQIQEWDKERTALEDERVLLEKESGEISLVIESLSRRDNELAVEVSRNGAFLEERRGQYQLKNTELCDITGGRPVQELIVLNEASIKSLQEAEIAAKNVFAEAEAEKGVREREAAAAEQSLAQAVERLATCRQRLDNLLAEQGFATRSQAESALLKQDEKERVKAEISSYRKELDECTGMRRELVKNLGGRALTEEEWQDWLKKKTVAQQSHEEALREQGAADKAYSELELANKRWNQLEQEVIVLGDLAGRLDTLKKLFQGNAFVEFLAGEQLMRVTRDASARLGQLTRYRYALETDSEGGFIIRDDANGGMKRPVSTLSGGETFITSLALALALSAQIQLKGQNPLEFFFLDEGFGTLDPELLEVVVSTLEQLRFERLTIGLISHVPELRNRLPRRLLVLPADPSGAGSRVIMDSA